MTYKATRRAHKSIRRLYAVDSAKKAIQNRLEWLQDAIDAVAHDQTSWSNIAFLTAYQDEQKDLEAIAQIFQTFEV